jgi:DNA repair photolyase
MARRSEPTIKGRGAQMRPANRFERTHLEPTDEASAPAADEESLPSVELETRTPSEGTAPLQTIFIADETRAIIAENDSPDIGFRYSVNPYRGCEHGCAYCYARPTHEYLGFDAGLDFETKIMVKHRAPELLQAALARPGWRGEVICFSGNTDCYQPAERRFELTRRCLQVALEARQPIGIITKNALVLRDLDLLREMATHRLVHANISVTSLDAELARTLEPRTSSPEARLRAMRELSAAGVPVRVMVAPVIPGLNDQEMPAILAAASASGATSAGYVLLRLPLAVEPVFRDWLTKHRPSKQDRIEKLIRDTRGGKYYQSKFTERQRGRGEYAAQIAASFKLFARKHGLDGPLQPELDSSQFRPPTSPTGQRQLF